MKLIAIDTSGPVCGVSLLIDGAIRYESTTQNKLTHSVNLMPMIDSALSTSGITLADLDRIAVVTGPGSFTGVRLGVSTVKGLAHGCGKPCVAVDALEAMAHSAGCFDGIICPIQDARAGQVYGAAFDGTAQHNRLLQDHPVMLEEFVEEIKALGQRYLFVGDGMPVHRARLEALLGSSSVMAPPQLAFLRPSAVAVLASASEEELDYQTLMPMYLRAPNAVRNKKLVEAAQHE